MFDVRDYQQQAIREVEAQYAQGKRSVLLTMPTGSGKTYTASQIIQAHAESGEHSVFIVDRVPLVEQAVKTLKRMGLQAGILQGENTRMRYDDQVTVASIQTIRRRGMRFASFIVIDEAHILHRAHIELIEQYFSSRVLGLSATPLRRDLGQHFEALVRGPSIKALMADGSLVGRIAAYCPSEDALRRILDNVQTRGGDFIEGELSRAINRKELVGDIVKTWQDKASDRQTLCFAVDIAHSRAIVEDFLNAGVNAEHLDAYTSSVERHRIIQGFKQHEIQLLSSVNVLGIGFDVPAASCGILARPTLSETLHMQQMGRLLRSCDGKDSALILGHAGNAVRFGLPDHFEVPELGTEDHTSTKSRRMQRKAVTCKSCGYVLDMDQMTCPACGLDRQRRQATVHYLDRNLVKYGDDGDEKQQPTEAERRNWYLALLWQARRRGRKDGWAYFAYLAKFNQKPPYAWRELEPVVPTDEQQRWIKYYEIKQAKSYHKRPIVAR
jgi:DNA repair protein RadD